MEVQDDVVSTMEYMYQNIEEIGKLILMKFYFLPAIHKQQEAMGL